ncbi:MAG: sensor histidine kinase, partial [Spirochaetia bacterium]
VRRLATVEKQRADLHARSVQAVLGPHFLFNSLDTIVGMVSQKNYDALMRTLKALTIQLEGAVRNFETEVSVAQELEYVSSYLEIQSQRYRGHFSVDMRVSPEVRFETIPRFCIQPVVENCFTHAIPYATDPVSILISVSDYDANTIAVVVSDSGPGMSEDARTALLEAFANDENPERHGVGLYTVHSRLATAYGEKYGIRIADSEFEGSEYGVDGIYAGMTVVVLLPKGPEL